VGEGFFLGFGLDDFIGNWFDEEGWFLFFFCGD
jgi:hypothetical protein